MSPKIPGGYYIKARKIQQSEIAAQPPVVREIWDWLLMNAQFNTTTINGVTIERGQVLTDYKTIRKALSWKVGYRTKMYSEDQTKKSMKRLRELRMVASTKAPGGLLITILNYDYYQNPQNYEGTNEGTNEGTTKAPRRHQTGTTPFVNPTKIKGSEASKNDKNDKNVNIYMSDPEASDNSTSPLKNKKPSAQKRSEQYLPLAKRLSSIIQHTKKIKHTPAQLKSWANEIRILVEGNGVSAERIKIALDWYGEHIGEQYVPVIESGASLRSKFLKLEAAISRSNFDKPKKTLVTDSWHIPTKEELHRILTEDG